MSATRYGFGAIAPPLADIAASGKPRNFRGDEIGIEPIVPHFA